MGYEQLAMHLPEPPKTDPTVPILIRIGDKECYVSQISMPFSIVKEFAGLSLTKIGATEPISTLDLIELWHDFIGAVDGLHSYDICIQRGDVLSTQSCQAKRSLEQRIVNLARHYRREDFEDFVRQKERRKYGIKCDILNDPIKYSIERQVAFKMSFWDRFQPEEV